MENENIASYPGYKFSEIFEEVKEMPQINLRLLFLLFILVATIAFAYFYILFNVDLPVFRP